MDREEYYSRYDNLSNMIIRAYTLLYMTEAIGDPGDPTVDPFNVVGYIDEVLKYMLVLTVWQICYDPDDDANTLQHLHKDIEGNTAKKPKAALGKLRKNIDCIRNEYLAHNDKQKSGIRISMDDISELLNELRKWLNSLCRPDLDSRVSEITDDELNARKEAIYAGFLALLRGRNGAGSDNSHA